MWYSIKQNIEPAFKMYFSFRFKRLISVQTQTTDNMLTLVFPKIKDLTNYKKDVPKNLNELPEYFAIKFGMESQISKYHIIELYCIV